MKIVWASGVILLASWLTLTDLLLLRISIPWLEIALSFVVLNLGILILLRHWRPKLPLGLAYYGTMFFTWLIFSYGFAMTASCGLLGICL